MNLQEITDKCPVHVYQQTNGFSPNFVHSLDASHMFLTSLRAREADIAFAGVHDSYWSHAADMDDLGRILRESFITIHQKPLLHDLSQQLREQYPKVKLPEPPETGTFDLSQVLRSPYFFS